MNAAAEYFLGWQAGELVGRSGHETWHPGGPDEALYAADDCRVCALFRDGKVHHVDGEVFRRKDGTSFPVEYTMTPILEGDRITGAVVTFRDITERRRTEEALRQSESKYRTLFEESKDVVFMNTPEGKVVDINPAGVDLFGFSSKDELLKADMGRDLCVNLGDWEVFSELMERKGFVKDHEMPLRKKSGESLIVLITATAVRDAEGAVMAHMLVLTKSYSNRWQGQFSYVWSKAVGSVGNTGRGGFTGYTFQNPNTTVVNTDGVMENDRTHEFKLSWAATRSPRSRCR